MAMLAAYMDASGNDGRSAVLVVCGYLAEQEDWASFQQEWKAMLDEEHIKVFHMTSLMALKGEFDRTKGWDEDRKQALLDKAFAIIQNRTICGVTGVINIGDCETYFPVPKDKKQQRRQLRKRYSKEYAVAGLCCVVGISRAAKRHGFSDPIHYTFEKGDDGYDQVERALARSSADEHEREHYMIGGCSRADKRTVSQLHPADILANQARHAMLNISDAKGIDLVRDTITGLVRPQDRWVYAYDRENLPTMKSLEDLP